MSISKRKSKSRIDGSFFVEHFTSSSGVKPATSNDTSISDTKPTAEYIRSDGYMYVKLPGMTHAAQVQMDRDTRKPIFMDKEHMTAANKEKFAAWIRWRK